MKTLTAPLTTQKDAEQSGWTELYDIYLKAAITTPWGTLSTLRVCNLGTDLAFFTPKTAPEPAGTQGNAATYKTWPIKREAVRSATKTQNDKLGIAASNVTAEFGGMLAAVDWYDVWFVIRKVSTTIAVPTADDYALVFIGQVDSARVTLQQLQFTLSNDLGNLQAIVPRENMHQNCRFNWADDQCTAIRFRTENFQAKTCGSGSTTTRVKSADLTEDAATAGYIAQAVTADSTTEKISLTAHGLGNGDRVKFAGTAVPGGLSAGIWYYVVSTAANDFKVALTEGGAAIDITSNGTSVTIDSTAPYGTDLIDALADGNLTSSSAKSQYVNQTVFRDVVADVFGITTGHSLVEDEAIVFTNANPPAPIITGNTYYVSVLSTQMFRVKAAPGPGPYIDLTTPGISPITITSQNYDAKQVKTSNPSSWKFGDTADWGDLTDGFWQIPDAQAGLANAALKPYIQIDFGSAKTPRVWRIKLNAGLTRRELVRLILFFSSPDASAWTHEHYFELPPVGAKWIDVLLPKASTKRYWRICIRSRWDEPLALTGFNKMQAFENGRLWWASGLIKFDAATATVALRNIARKVLASYNGVADVESLPAAPANGDTFAIERGCPRTFNACTERRNWENFGGFLDLPNQTVIR